MDQREETLSAATWQAELERVFRNLMWFNHKGYQNIEVGQEIYFGVGFKDWV